MEAGLQKLVHPPLAVKTSWVSERRNFLSTPLKQRDDDDDDDDMKEKVSFKVKALKFHAIGRETGAINVKAAR